MKPGIVIRDPTTTYSLLSVIDGSFEEQVKTISKAGYKSVSLMTTHPDQVNIGYVKQVLQEYAIIPVEIITGEMRNQRNLTLPSCSNVDIEALIAYASELSSFICLGKFLGNANPEELSNFAARCKEKCVMVAIEPIPATSIPNVAIARHVIDEFQLGNVGITLDTCHANSIGDIAGEIFAAGHKLYNVHIADSNREYPGSGNINFKLVFETLRLIRYYGSTMLEVYAKPNADTAFRLGTQGLMRYINAK